MTREEARELAKVMIAYADGKDIEHRLYGDNKWATFNGDDKSHYLSFDFSKYAYRIKKEPTYRSFKNKEECLSEMMKHQPFGLVEYYGVFISIMSIDDYGVEYLYEKEPTNLDYSESFKHLKFIDGTPFGIKEE